MSDVRTMRPFHERFGIEVGADEAKRRFINRVSISIFDSISGPRRQVGRRLISTGLDIQQVCTAVAYYLGDDDELKGSYEGVYDLRRYVRSDFDRCLQVLEALYQFVQGTGGEAWLSDSIDRVIRSAEVDLGIGWQPPKFVPKGAKLLDGRLVNDPLHWLDQPEYKSVYDPFQNGISHFMESENNPQLYKAVIRDMYEAVEALAKIVGRPNKDLSTNAELFISKVKASDRYKTLLKDYISYANDFRHAEDRPGTRSIPSRAEVESFVYLTGLFIRLAVQQPE